MQTNSLFIIMIFVVFGGCSQEKIVGPESPSHVQGTDSPGESLGLGADGKIAAENPVQSGFAVFEDIAITEFTGPDVVTFGETLRLHAEVANISGVPVTEPFAVQVGIMDLGRVLKRVTLPGLAAWDTLSGDVEFVIPTAKLAALVEPGTYRFYCAHNHSDPDRSNNYAFHDVELTAGSPYPFPDNPDQLMDNFKAAYGSMDADGYRTMLTPDYLMFLLPATAQEFPELGETLDFTEESRIADHMFGGASGMDGQGNPVSPVSAIDFQDLVRVSVWELTPLNDPLPNVHAAVFELRINFERSGDTTLQTTGPVKIYVTSQDSLYGGEVRPYYQMVGLGDFTGGDKLGIEETNWGWVKALYR